ADRRHVDDRRPRPVRGHRTSRRRRGEGRRRRSRTPLRPELRIRRDLLPAGQIPEIHLGLMLRRRRRAGGLRNPSARIASITHVQRTSATIAIVRAYVGVTDNNWYRFLADRPGMTEVNFWQPSGARGFHAVAPGEPFFFKTHHPHNRLVGGGFF